MVGSADFVSRFTRQSWAMYTVGMIIISLRWIARVQRLGFKGLQADDYLMLLVAAWYTTLVTSLNAVNHGGGSNLLRPGEAAHLTAHEIQVKMKGSKLVILSEQANLNVMYTIKACMLFLYHRLTTGLWQQRAVQALAIYVACGFVGSELGFFFACRPFHDYWAVPPADPQCATLQHYAITEGVFNISSDLLMLAVVLPLVFRVRVPPKQKFVLCIVFGLGIFVIIAAILTKVFNFSDVYSPDYMFWYIVQASVAVYVSNLPMVWAFLRQLFPFLRFTSYYRGAGYKSGAYHLSSNPNSRTNNSRLKHAKLANMTIGGHKRSGDGDDYDNELDGRAFQMSNFHSKTTITGAADRNGDDESYGTSSECEARHGQIRGQSSRGNDGSSIISSSSQERINGPSENENVGVKKWHSAKAADSSVHIGEEDLGHRLGDSGSSCPSSMNVDLEKVGQPQHQGPGDYRDPFDDNRHVDRHGQGF